MRIVKILIVAAVMMFAGMQAVDAKLTKPSGGSVSGNVVISKVFYSGSIRLNDAKPKNYLCHLYIELYNNSTDTLDLKGMYVALTNSDSGEAAWTAAAMAAEHKDSAVVKQIFQLSPDDTYRMDPGQSVVITNCAIDHSQIAEGNVDLSTADFEAKSTNNAFNFHSDAVAELKIVKSFGTADYINMLNPGPTGIMLLASDTNLDKCPTTFGRGKTTGNEYTIVPLFKSIDCVDIVRQKVPSADDKRFADSYDAGFTCTADIGTFSGEAVVRKTAFVTSDGRTVLYDTNNSSVDFEVTTDLSIRSYSQTPVGLTATTITIPQSGYLPINTDQPFCGDKDVAFVHVNVSNSVSTTDLTYYEFPGDSILLIKGPWIAVGKPGEHALYLSESQGVMRTRTSIVNWADEDTKSLSQNNRMIYKFMAEAGKVGFQRVPATDGRYNQATFTDADRLHIVVTEAIADKIAAASGATGHADLDFIAWHGITPEEAAINGVSNIRVVNAARGMVYDLQGRRVESSILKKGLYIVNGKKVLY